MNLEIITPDKNVYNGEVNAVTLTGVNGQFQVLNGHAPMVSTLANKGNLIIEDTTGKKQTLLVDGGVMEILGNKLLVLAEAVE